MTSRTVYLQKWVMDEIRSYGEDIANISIAGTSKKISKESEAALTARGKYYEVCAAILAQEESGLPVAVDFTRRSWGDGHRNDILLPHSSIQVKGRWPRVRPDFILAKNQGTRLLDDIGLVVLGEPGLKCWATGFFTYDEWDDLVTTIPQPVGGGKYESRQGVLGSDMHEWHEIGSAIQAAEARGRERGERKRLCSGGLFLYNGQMRTGMDDEV